MKNETPRLIDKVTVVNLDLSLRMCNIRFNPNLINKIIDLVELIEEKGDDVSIKDILCLQAQWETPMIFHNSSKKLIV